MREHETRRPVVAVSPTGNLVSPTVVGDHGSADWVVVDGSREARTFLQRFDECDLHGPSGSRTLDVTYLRHRSPLSFTCGAQSATWLDDVTIVLSIGGENGAVLAKVTMPGAASASVGG